MRKKLKPVFVIALVVALIAAAILLLRSGDGDALDKTVTFSDGTTMTLRAVSHGNEHRYLRGNLKERLIGLLPKKLRAKYASTSVMLSSRGALVFWIERRGPGPPNGDPQLVLCDGTGLGVSGFFSMMRLGPQGSPVEGWMYEYWPRRQRTFTLRIYEQGKRYPDATNVGEFTIRNPLFRKYPVWDAPPPPVTARDGDMTVTLCRSRLRRWARSEQMETGPEPDCVDHPRGIPRGAQRRAHR